MHKKITTFLIIILFISGCDYSPIHSNKKNNIEIKITDVTGDDEINDYISRELERNSKSSPEKIEIKINTNFTKRILAKDTKSFATDYELKVVGNFELKNENNTQSFIISENFRYKNLNNNYEQNNYESMIKRNLAKTIVSKLNLRINNFK
tara:strand:+ start:1422 stop:1874 length:453 start_codon:yes stop_codon:yes gene_type:complete